MCWGKKNELYHYVEFDCADWLGNLEMRFFLRGHIFIFIFPFIYVLQDKERRGDA